MTPERLAVEKWLAQWGIHNDGEILGLLDSIEAAARVAAPSDGHTHYPVTDVTGTVFSYTHPAPVCPYCVAVPSDGLREALYAEIGRHITDAEVLKQMGYAGIPLHGRPISLDLQAREVAARMRRAAMEAVDAALTAPKDAGDVDFGEGAPNVDDERSLRDPDSPQWEACKVCGGDHWTLDHGPDDGAIE